MVEFLTGAERQRRWSAEQKLSILQEAFGPDGSVSVVARRHVILPQQIYAWRKFSPPEVGSSEERIVCPGFGYRAGEPGRRGSVLKVLQIH
ncbi:transposase [Sinorhizobium meliloti]|uniref:transposase n=1 Tax=Rhizobium meliloti TaxID=382 RepID=UPI0029B56F19|nr:transposase [Sinorhizobium meliloti]MDW9695334.1 transposase [Sinorhizobium meliloti]MDW9720206.1 transposase [Sinorhizobium meliloti]MDW9757358.1 transposase [Sinorhizobium meliloti]